METSRIRGYTARMRKLLALLMLLFLAHSVVLPPLAQAHAGVASTAMSSHAGMSATADDAEAVQCCLDPASDSDRSLSSCAMDCQYLAANGVILPGPLALALVFDMSAKTFFRDIVHSRIKPPISSSSSPAVFAQAFS